MARKKKKPASGKKKGRSRKKKKKGDAKSAAGGVASTAEGAGHADPIPAEAPPDAPRSVAQDGAEPHTIARDEGEPRAAPPGADDAPHLIDPDEESATEDQIAALIAQTVATAPPLERADEPEPAVIDLDADLEPLEETTAAEAPEAAPAARAEPDAGALDRDAGETPGAGAAETPGTEALETPEPAAEEPPPAAGEPQAPSPSEADEAAAEAVRRLLEAGPVSSSEVRARLLAEALAHAEHKDARYRVPFSDTPTAGRWKALVGITILLVAGLVALAPPSWATPDPPTPLPAPERARSLHAALLLQAEQVEAFRVREQRLPDTLDEVAEALPGVRYVRSGTRGYQLIAYLPDGSAVVYDSVSPTPAFEALRPGWRPQERAP